jgi:hypothetical protein
MAGTRSSQRARWGSCLLVALLVVSAVLASAQVIQPPMRVFYETKAETLYTDPTAAKSFDAAMSLCMANGLNLFSGESAERTQRVWTLTQQTFPGATNYSTYSLISAKKMPGNTRCSYTNRLVTSPTAQLDPWYCIFSIQWGLFSEMLLHGTFAEQPGFSIYQGAFKYYLNSTVPLGQNGIYNTGFRWEGTVANPNGQNYTVINTGGSQAAGAFANIAAVAPADFYLPLSKFVTACEAQLSISGIPETFKPTQPVFIKGYKDLTWVQEHWWVVFLIVGIVLLILLFAILIFCCVTSMPPKEGAPIAPMVLRERNGQAYVNASDDDSTPKSRNLVLGDANRGIEVPQQRGSGLMMPMMPVPVVDPEDLIQATPSVYSQEDVMQSVEGDSAASDDESSLPSDDEEAHD